MCDATSLWHLNPMQGSSCEQSHSTLALCHLAQDTAAESQLSTSAMALTFLTGSLQPIDFYLCVVHGQRCSNQIQRVLRCWGASPTCPGPDLLDSGEGIFDTFDNSLTSGIPSAKKTQYRYPQEYVTRQIMRGPMLTIQCTANGQ